MIEICSSSCLHSKRLCCKVNLILLGGVNLIGAFNLAGVVKTDFLLLISLLNLMFSSWQLLQGLSEDKSNAHDYGLKYSS